MGELTIFTPTYNRREQLEKLYHSLCSQTTPCFLWMIVDDGSTDGTQELVNQWMREGRVDIQYSYQENVGKYKALEKGINSCETPWFICVDSDDLLKFSAVQQMLNDIASAQQSDDIGIIYPQGMNGFTSHSWIPKDVKHVNIVDTRVLYGVAETAILFKVEYLKKLVFLQFPGEKFVSEEVLYLQLVQYGKFTPRDVVFYLSEYQTDGVTKNLFKYWVKNPQGTIHLLKARFQDSVRYPCWIRVKERIKSIMNLNALCMTCGLAMMEVTPSKKYSAILYFPSLIWRKIRFG